MVPQVRTIWLQGEGRHWSAGAVPCAWRHLRPLMSRESHNEKRSHAEYSASPVFVSFVFLERKYLLQHPRHPGRFRGWCLLRGKVPCPNIAFYQEPEVGMARVLGGVGLKVLEGFNDSHFPLYWRRSSRWPILSFLSSPRSLPTMR